MQAESRTVEAAFVFACDLDPMVLEAWDQSQPLQLRRTLDGGRLHVSTYTPDFLCLHKERVELVECKTLRKVQALAASKPRDWVITSEECCFVPARDAAASLGVSHRVFVVGDWASTYLSNLEYLWALSQSAPTRAEDTQFGRVRILLEKQSTTIHQLCRLVPKLEPSTVHMWLASSKVFGALKAELLSQPDAFRVFLEPEAAAVHETLLLQPAQQANCPEENNQDLHALLRARPSELRHAAALWTKYQEVINGTRLLTRNEYRYKASVEEALRRGFDPRYAFLPNFASRGNRNARLTPRQEEIIQQVIDDELLTGKVHTWTALQGKVDSAFACADVPTASPETVRQRGLRIPPEELARARFGNRGYHAARRPVDSRNATLRSDIPGLVAHIDSTQFDNRLWTDMGLDAHLACPWVYVFYDEACTRAQGFWLGFSRSSRFPLALAVRDMATRQGGLSPFLFSDRGSEFGSIWWEVLLAQRSITKYLRPPGAPRFGGLQESSLKQLNEQVAHRLAGSTWADQKGRRADGSRKSRATARHLFEIALNEVRHYFSEVWNKVGHGHADGSPDAQWESRLVDYGDVMRPVTIDRDFLISTAIPLRAHLGPRKGIRLGPYEYWSDELQSHRWPIELQETRIDPACPSLLYVKVRGEWFDVRARHFQRVERLGEAGSYLEYERAMHRGACNRRERRSAAQTMAERLQRLETASSASLPSQPQTASQSTPAESMPQNPCSEDLAALPELSYLE